MCMYVYVLVCEPFMTRNNAFMEHIAKKKNCNNASVERIEERKKKKGFLLKKIKLSHFILWLMTWSEVALNDPVIVQRYPFLNGVVGDSTPAMKSSLYLTGKKLGR
jgi:hypothetical protein